MSIRAERNPVRGASTVAELLLAAAIAFAAASALAWPWLRSAATAIPDRAALGDAAAGADSRLVLWILSWATHALSTDPRGLFDANIFHPAPRMLAGSEHLLGFVPLAAPIYLATGNPVLAGNVVAFVTYPLAALAMYALLRQLELGRWVAAAGAVAFAVGPLRIPADVHVVQYSNHCLPVVLLAALAVGSRTGLWLAGVTMLAALSSYYIAALVFVLLGVETIVTALSRGAKTAGLVALWTAAGFAAVLLLATPYVSGTGPAAVLRAPAATIGVSKILGYLIQPQLVDPGNRQFGIGWGVAALASVGLSLPLLLCRAPSVRWWRWVALTVAGYGLAFGPYVAVNGTEIPLPYSIVLHTPLWGLRAFPRFAVLGHMGLVGLAAEAGAVVLEGATSRASRTVFGAGLVLAAALPRVLSLTSLPLTALPSGDAIPEAYRWLARHAEGPLLEPPGPGVTPRGILLQTESMYFSTFHWLPLLNGQTGYYPPWFTRAVANEIDNLPAPAAIQALVDLTHVRWILVRPQRVGPGKFRQWLAATATAPGLRQLRLGDDLLLEVLSAPRHPWASILAAGAPRGDQTILGTPLALVADTAQGAIRVPDRSLRVVRGDKLWIRVEVQNTGSIDWPVLTQAAAVASDLTAPGTVMLEAAWRTTGGRGLGRPTVHDLPRDVAASETVTWSLPLRAPATSGSSTLELSLVQVGAAALDGVSPARLAVVVTNP